VTGAEWATLIIGGVGGTAGVAALLNAIFGRGKTRSEAAQIITGSAVSMMNEFEEDAKAARTEMRAVRTEALALAEELHQLRMAILQPTATIETLRALVVAGSGPAVNGRPKL